MKQSFSVTGMSCAACSAHVEKAVCALPGIQSVSVNLLANSMAAEYDESQLSAQEICQAVEDAGYGAAPASSAKGGKAPVKEEADPVEAEIRTMKRRLIGSLIFMIPLFYICMGHMLGLPLPAFFTGAENSMVYAMTQLLLTLPILYLNDKYFINGFQALMRKAPNMDSLIAIGAASGLIYSLYALYVMAAALGRGDFETAMTFQHKHLYLESAAMILTLIDVGKYLETRSKGKTSDALRHLMALQPKVATVIREGAEAEIPIEEVEVGDLILVKPGQSFPVDGKVVSGSTSVNESALTGEPIPAEKHPGDKVYGGTINGNGTTPSPLPGWVRILHWPRSFVWFRRPPPPKRPSPSWPTR